MIPEKNTSKRPSGNNAAAARINGEYSPILTTKLHIPPVRSNLVSRPRLLHSLTLSPEDRLILISAPAGFGKTTLLSEWLSTHPYSSCWLSLDRNENDPVRFWMVLISALQITHPSIGESALALLRNSSASSMEPIVTVLLNDLNLLKSEMILVLDDYHVINNPTIHKSLTFFLDHLPTIVHVVIATRADPPMPLANLRVKGYLKELRVDQLRFTLEETAEFLNQRMALNLSSSDIKILEDRTEGWIASLQLAAMSIKGRDEPSALIQALSNSQRFILDYLVEEVLDLQPVYIQTFLLKTCILERMCAPLCDAIIDETSLNINGDIPDSLRLAASPKLAIEGKRDQHLQNYLASSKILEYLERANLFIVPLDHERKWYRYHHLFADLLRGRLNQSLGDRQVQMLHSRAAVWYEGNHFLADAIDHALTAKEFGYAARIIETVADTAWLNGEFYQVLHWIESLPDEVKKNRPWLNVWHAWSRIQAGKMDGIEQLIDNAEHISQSQIDESAGPDHSLDQALVEQISALRVTLAGLRYETEKTIELASRALERPAVSHQAASLMARTNVLNVLGFAYYLKGELSQSVKFYSEARTFARQSGFLFRELLVVHKLVFIYQILGRLHQSFQLSQETLDALQEQDKGSFFAVGYLYCGLSNLLYEWNQLNEARQMLARGLRLNDLVQVPHLAIEIYQGQARHFLAQGKFDAAQTALQDAAHLISKHYCWPEVISANECYQVKLWLARSDVKSAVQWAERYLLNGSQTIDFNQETQQIARARVLIEQGLLDEAFNLLCRLSASAEAGSRTGRLIEILNLQALVLSRDQSIVQQQEVKITALDALGRSLALAKSEDYLRLFVDEGPSMFFLLRQAVAQGIETDYVKMILGAFQIQIPSGKPGIDGTSSVSNIQSNASTLIEPLTDRELDVLRLVAEGLSNREIANRLVLAVGTVKSHIHSICGKLDAQNRTQVILRAQQLGLLS